MDFQEITIPLKEKKKTFFFLMSSIRIKQITCNNITKKKKNLSFFWFIKIKIILNQLFLKDNKKCV